MPVSALGDVAKAALAAKLAEVCGPWKLHVTAREALVVYLAARGEGGDSSDSSIHDAAKQSKTAAAAWQGGSATRAHVLRSRHRCSLLRRRGCPLSSLVSSISWLIRITWTTSSGWACFGKHRHGTASPWAEATGGASRRTMGAWHYAALGRVLSVKS